jgi:hypothetical protein
MLSEFLYLQWLVEQKDTCTFKKNMGSTSSIYAPKFHTFEVPVKPASTGKDGYEFRLFIALSLEDVGQRMAEFWVPVLPGTTKSGRVATLLQKCIFLEFLRRRLTVF